MSIGWRTCREGDPCYEAYRVLLTTVLLVLLLGVLAPQFAQNVPTAPGEDDRESPTAIGLLRTINTAEVVETI